MLKHSAVWAIIINNFTFHFAFYVVMNWMPTYYNQVCVRLPLWPVCSMSIPCTCMDQYACACISGI